MGYPVHRYIVSISAWQRIRRKRRAIQAWSHSGSLFEVFCEIVIIVDTDFRRYFTDIQRGIAQQFLSRLDPQLFDLFADTASIKLLGYPIEAGVTDMKLLADRIGGKHFVQIGYDVLIDLERQIV